MTEIYSMPRMNKMRKNLECQGSTLRNTFVSVMVVVKDRKVQRCSRDEVLKQKL